ncbi:MAG TPA: S1C family serine protease [Bryobacteraceae bacterium]|jgi:S1-C subfamily serine protease|nr:S1C family serine protease [Bryobacteraceae bacterium]
MSSTYSSTELSGLSQRLVQLVEQASGGVVAVKAAPYRVVTGLSLSEDLIVVADHALRREGRVPVQASGSTSVGTILGREPSLDLAFLKVEGVKLTPLTSGDGESFRAGMLAAVIGMTMDVGPSASLGILGAVGGARRTWRGGTLDTFLRLDVNLYPSQSGAAVVDIEGKLIGMATPGLLRHSAVAVPMATLQRVSEELLREGRIRHGYIGVGLQPVTILKTLRERHSIEAESGLIVLSVEADSPAEQAGLQLGDVLISIDSKALEDVDDLQALLRGDAVGKPVKAKLLRGGEPVEAEITIGERARKSR